jgi:hypothetical protein
MPWSPSIWPPVELAQFVQRCTYCDVRVRRHGRGWQGIDGLFICWRGTQLPTRDDLDRRHRVGLTADQLVALPIGAAVTTGTITAHRVAAFRDGDGWSVQGLTAPMASSELAHYGTHWMPVEPR